MFPEGGQTRKHCFLAMFPKDGQTRKHCFLAMFPEGGQTRKHCFIAMFPKGGQTRKHCFLTMFPEGGQTRKHCFIAMFPKGGQTRKHCFLAMFPEGARANQKTLFPSHVSRRWTNQEALFLEPCFPKDKGAWTNQETLGPFIRAKISRGLNKPRLKYKSRTTRINSQFAISRSLFRPSFQLLAYFSRGLLQIDCLYESSATYLSRGLFRPRLIFARINGPIVS
jgi:hypothetical protein